MSNSFKLILAILLLMGFIFINTSTSNAQPPPGQRGRGMPDSTRIVQMVDDLVKALSLNDEQKKKISEIYFKHFDELKKEREKHQGNREEMRKIYTESREKRDTAIKALLTDKQKEAYDKYIQERRQRRGGRGPREG